MSPRSKVRSTKGRNAYERTPEDTKASARRSAQDLWWSRAPAVRGRARSTAGGRPGRRGVTRRSYLSWRRPIELPCGSVNQDASANPDVGDPVHGPQLGELLDLDAACPQLGDLVGQVVHAPACLGLLIGGPGDALGDHQPAVTATPEGEELLIGQQHLQANCVAVEPAGHAGSVASSITSTGWSLSMRSPPCQGAAELIAAGRDRGTAIGAAAWSPAASPPRSSGTQSPAW